jgi:hypothetical protein
MRKLIIIRSGKHVVPGRMTGGREKCQVAQIAVRMLSLLCTLILASFDLGENTVRNYKSPQQTTVFNTIFNL